MSTQQLFFEDLGLTIDSWADAIRALVDESHPDLTWVDNPEAFLRIREVIRDSQSSTELEQVFSEVIRGVIHSVLVTLDGGSKLADTTNLALVDDSGEKLPRNLHEMFVDHLVKTNRL